jgi:hypothetical protein
VELIAVDRGHVQCHATPADQRLLDRWAQRARPLAKRRVVDRYCAPAEQRQAMLGQAMLKQPARAGTLLLIVW